MGGCWLVIVGLFSLCLVSANTGYVRLSDVTGGGGGGGGCWWEVTGIVYHLSERHRW